MEKKYDPHKYVPKSLVNHTLKVVNKIRKFNGVKPLTKLPPGVPQSTCDCPIGVALTPVAKKLGPFALLEIGVDDFEPIQIKNVVMKCQDPLSCETFDNDEQDFFLDDEKINQFITAFDLLVEKDDE